MRVVAVVVAYNRRQLLLECVDALAAQSGALDSIVVVDNASDDGSGEAVRAAHPNVDMVTLPVNTGGAGGFTMGIAHAVTQRGADLVWIMDDDTIPTKTALDELLTARKRSDSGAVVFASRVVWNDGEDHPMNTPRRKPLASRRERERASVAGGVPVRSASFVSVLVDAAAITRAGLPIAQYFIWNDDFEFTARLLKHARGLFVPASVVLHKTKARADTDTDPGERFYFEVRNKLWLFRASRALHWFEVPIYVAATARRWTRTLVRSSDRKTLTRTFRTGWHDGTHAKPRANGAYLASLGVDTSDVTRFESTR